jgi:FHA domain
MSTGLSIQVLGRVRGGQFSPCALQPCSYFNSDRIAIGSRAWNFPALVLTDSSVSPKHALIVREDQGWVIQDMDSDNGIRAISAIPEPGMHLESGQQAFRFAFREELCCSVGAVVLRLKAFPKF